MLSCITVLLISYSLVIMYVSFLRVTVFVTVDTLTCFFFCILFHLFTFHIGMFLFIRLLSWKMEVKS